MISAENHHVFGPEVLIFRPRDNVVLLNKGMATEAAAKPCILAEHAAHISGCSRTVHVLVMFDSP
jgi:hypothetical protein